MKLRLLHCGICDEIVKTEKYSVNPAEDCPECSLIAAQYPQLFEWVIKAVDNSRRRLQKEIDADREKLNDGY